MNTAPPRTNSLRDIERLVTDENIQVALDAINSCNFSADEYGEKEFLLGYAFKISGDKREAITHYLNAALSSNSSQVAASELLLMLAEYGCVREARYFYKAFMETIQKGDRSNLFDINSLNSIVNSYASRKIVSIHQPSYLPWLGYMHKIFYSDKFVIYDEAEFSKKSFIKRTLIRKQSKAEATTYLTIPTLKHSDFIKIGDIKIDNLQNWREQHLRKISAAYSKTEFFKTVYPEIEDAFQETIGSGSLVEVTNVLNQRLMKLLNINKEIFLSSDLLKCEDCSSAHEKNMKMCQMLGGSVYFSGSVARDYQEGEPIPNGMSLIYQDIWNYLEKNPYLTKENFVNGLSTLDALFYAGPEQITELFEEYDNPSNNHIFFD